MRELLAVEPLHDEEHGARGHHAMADVADDAEGETSRRDDARSCVIRRGMGRI